MARRIVLSSVNVACSLTGTGTALLDYSVNDEVTAPLRFILEQNGVELKRQSGNRFVNLQNGTYLTYVETQTSDRNQYAISNPVEFTVSCQAQLLVSYTKKDCSYQGSNDGQIVLSISGATKPYQINVSSTSGFTLSDSINYSTYSMFNLVPAVYTIVITSQEGLSKTLTILITEPSSCDLLIKNIAVGRESMRRNRDAYLIVNTTTSNRNTPVLYQLCDLDNTIIYDFQTGNTFTNLTEKQYIVNVKQQAGCQQSDIVTINRRLPLYSYVYQDFLQEYTRIEILQSNYAGASESCIGGSEPFLIQYENEGDEKTESIKSSSATIQLLNDKKDKYSQFFTSDNRKYRLDIYKSSLESDLTDDVDKSLLFYSGYIIPELLVEDYISGKYITNISFSDGLGELKTSTFDLPDGYYTLSYLLQYLISKTDLHLPISTSVNIFDSSFSGYTFQSDTLEKYKVSSRAFQDENGKKFMCDEVLKTILETFWLRIFQHSGKWYIINVPKSVLPFILRNYDEDYNYIDYELFNPELNIYNNDTTTLPQIILNNGTKEMKPAFKSVNSTLIYGNYGIFQDKNFKYFNKYTQNFATYYKLQYWTVYSTAANNIVIPEANGKDGNIVFFYRENTTFNYNTNKSISSLIASIPQSIPNPYDPSDSSLNIQVGINIKITANILNSIDTFPAPGKDIYTQLVLVGNSSGTTYYYSSNLGGWTTSTASNNEYYIFNTSTANSFQDFEMNISSIPESGSLQLTVFQPVSDNSYQLFKIKSIESTFLVAGTDYATEETYSVENSGNYKRIPDNFEFKLGDTVSDSFTATIKNLSGQNTSSWNYLSVSGLTGSTSYKKLFNVITDDISFQNSKPTQNLRITILGQFSPLNIFQDFYGNNNHFFTFNGMTYSDKQRQVSGEFFELLKYPLNNSQLYETGIVQTYEDGRTQSYEFE
jgi:hypothetical protein